MLTADETTSTFYWSSKLLSLFWLLYWFGLFNWSENDLNLNLNLKVKFTTATFIQIYHFMLDTQWLIHSFKYIVPLNL